MRFYVLPVGYCDDDKGKVFTPGVDEGKRVIAPNWAGLIQTQGLNILIDTGMHPIHITDPKATFRGTKYEDIIVPKMEKSDSILHRLELLGLRPKDINLVINTHLHFDHCGCNCFFKDATFFVQHDHYQYALSNPKEFPPQYFLIPGINYELVHGEFNLLPGIKIIRCPGHAPGMMCVVLTLKDNSIVIASDAISIKESLDRDHWEGYMNPVLARNSALRLSAICDETSGLLLYGHDPGWWPSVKVAPDYYE